MSATVETVTPTTQATETSVTAAPVTTQTGGKRTRRKASKKGKTADKNKVKTVGSRREVWDGRAKKTSGGLTKDRLILNSSGRPVSKAQHEKGLKQYVVLKPWRDHLNAFRAAHPEMSLKEQMKSASKTYKKTKAKASKKAVKKTSTKKAGSKKTAGKKTRTKKTKTKSKKTAQA